MTKTLTLRLITPVNETIIADHIVATPDNAEIAAKFADAYVNLYDLTDVDITMTDNTNDDVYNFDFTNKTWSVI